MHLNTDFNRVAGVCLAVIFVSAPQGQAQAVLNPGAGSVISKAHKQPGGGPSGMAGMWEGLGETPDMKLKIQFSIPRNKKVARKLRIDMNCKNGSGALQWGDSKRLMPIGKENSFTFSDGMSQVVVRYTSKGDFEVKYDSALSIDCNGKFVGTSGAWTAKRKP